jgi:acid stress-induced BolA-like protein IbaG/YrbA
VRARCAERPAGEAAARAGAEAGGLKDNSCSLSLSPHHARPARTMASPTPEDVRTYLAAGLTCSHLEVEGDGRHFFATIVSPQFEGLSRVRRHQVVYAALGERMREEIHALSMKTLTPAEWASEQPGSAPAGAATPHH